MILFSIASMLALAPTRLPIPGVDGEFSRWLKSSEHEADHEPPYNAEVKGEFSYICTPSHALTFWRRNLFLILAHSVYKMWIIQEPNTLELWNKLHFEEEKKNGEYTPCLKYSVPIFVE